MEGQMLDVTKIENRVAFGLAEFAEMVGVSEAMLKKEIRAGRLPVKRCGRRVLILKDDFMNYLNGETKDEK
jgi:excisionase family DNA binding protein